jgi:uncharacterized protein YpmS
MKNKWKSLFFLLALINITILIFFLLYIFSPAEQTKIIKEDIGTENAQFHVQTNKKDLGLLVNQYIAEQQDGPLNYQVSLDEYVNLTGVISIFTQKLQMKITFEPKVLENGDLLLQYEKMSIGRLRLPASLVLKYVGEQNRFPDWIVIQPNDESVYVKLQSMKLKSGLIVKANEFDLPKDNISFRLLVPIKKGASH